MRKESHQWNLIGQLKHNQVQGLLDPLPVCGFAKHVVEGEGLAC